MGPPNTLQVFVKKGYSRYKSSNTLAAHCFPRPSPAPIDRISRRSHQSKKDSFFFPSLILANQITLICGFLLGFPHSSDGKESACRAGAPGSVSGLGRSSGGRNGYPFQYSCLENSMDKEAWQATVHRATKSQTRLSD